MMTVENVVLLEMILDAVALFLGGMAIAGVLMLRTRRAKVPEVDTQGERTAEFNDMLLDMVLQTERTFQRVTDALREERESLEEASGTTSIQNEMEEPAISNVTSLSDAPRRRRNEGPQEIKRKRSNDEDNTSDRYREVVERARNGMSEQEIIDEVQLPRSEIELIMELNRC